VEDIRNRIYQNTIDKNLKKVQSLVHNEYVPKNPSDLEINTKPALDTYKQEKAEQIKEKTMDKLSMEKSPYSKKLKKMHSAYIHSMDHSLLNLSEFVAPYDQKYE